MKISFQRKKEAVLPETVCFWMMKVETATPQAISDLLIPELYFDFFYIQTGEILCVDAASGDEQSLTWQTLKTIFTRPFTFILKAPLTLYGARLPLSFGELFWQKEMPANTFLDEAWVSQPVTDLASFSDQVVATIQQRRVKKTITHMVLPSLEESDWLACYSPRHKRRLYKSVFGISKKEMQAIQNIHLFLGQTCDFAAQTPRIVEHVNAELFYDQPHLNNAFKKMTGLAPLAYFEANTILQDNLMAASYNAVSNTYDRIES